MDLSAVNSIVIQRDFYKFLQKEKIIDSKDYHQISKICPATRHHIKHVIEDGYTTNSETYDAIIAFYTAKKTAADQQKQIIKKKDFASQI